MAYKPFKMKGSPMQRNFGIGSPLHDKTSLTGKLKAAKYAIKRGFKSEKVDDLSTLYDVYKSAKKRHRKDPTTVDKPLSRAEAEALRKKKAK